MSSLEYDETPASRAAYQRPSGKSYSRERDYRRPAMLPDAAPATTPRHKVVNATTPPGRTTRYNRSTHQCKSPHHWTAAAPCRVKNWRHGESLRYPPAIVMRRSTIARLLQHRQRKIRGGYFAPLASNDSYVRGRSLRPTHWQTGACQQRR